MMKSRANMGGRPPKNAPVTTPEMARKTAENLMKGMKITAALRDAGFPKGTVKNGRNSINRAIRSEIQKRGRRFIELGRDLSAEDQAALVRGRLAENTIMGSDAGSMSAKILGSDRRIALWTPDAQVGVVVLSPPPVPVIKYDCPILPESPLRSEALREESGVSLEEKKKPD